MKKLLLIASVFVFAVVNSVFAAPTSTMLEGKTFVGEMGKTGDTKGDPDNFIFLGGRFRSTACDEYGYTATPFTVSSIGTNSSFEATAKNDKGAKMTWKGNVTGDQIEGTAMMTTADGTPGDNYWFKGTLKK